MQDALLDPIKIHLDLDAAMRSLPPTADAVAAALERYGIRGSTSDTGCPLALYLRGRMLHAQPGCHVSVSTWTVAARAVDGSATREILPDHLQEFVHRFDERGYPRLIGRS